MSPWLVFQTRFGSSEPTADLAFLAMTHYRLGHRDTARTMLAQLRARLAGLQRSGFRDAEAQGFLREAESLIKD